MGDGEPPAFETRRKSVPGGSGSAWPRPVSRPVPGLTFSMPHTVSKAGGSPSLGRLSCPPLLGREVGGLGFRGKGQHCQWAGLLSRLIKYHNAHLAQGCANGRRRAAGSEAKSHFCGATKSGPWMGHLFQTRSFLLTTQASLIKSESTGKPGSVVGNHSSGSAVTDDLKRPTRRRRGPRHGLPIWSCSGWGLPSHRVLPPARCALTAPFHPYPDACASGAVYFLLHFP